MTSSDQSIRDLERQLTLTPNDPSLQEQLISAKLRTTNVTRLLIEDAIRFRRVVFAILDGKAFASTEWLKEAMIPPVTAAEILAYLDLSKKEEKDGLARR